MEEENRLLRQEIAELTARLELQQSKIELHPIVDYPARTGTPQSKLYITYYFILFYSIIYFKF